MAESVSFNLNNAQITIIHHLNGEKGINKKKDAWNFNKLLFDLHCYLHWNRTEENKNKKKNNGNGDDKEFILYLKQCLMDVWAKRAHVRKKANENTQS